MSLAREDHQRGLKDFLTLYNTITEFCFNKCVSNFNERITSDVENHCVEACSGNYVQFNQRFMFNFVDHQERRKRESEAAVVEVTRKEEVAAQEALAKQQAEALESLVASPLSPDNADSTPVTHNISGLEDQSVDEGVS